MRAAFQADTLFGMNAELVSIQTGRVRKHTMPAGTRVDFRHENWTSAIYKDSVGAARVRVGPLTIEGDEQADLEHHGGPDNVVLAYDADRYPGWREELGMPTLAYGAFGENFSVRGCSDETVCIGDVWEVGDEGLQLQVTQARQPCYKLARRLGQPHIVKMVKERSAGGWYLRTLRPGFAAAGMVMILRERPHAYWSVARAVQVMYNRKKDEGAARALAALPELSARWKRELVEP